MTPSIDKTLHQFLTLLLISTLLPNLTFYLIVRGYHRTFATGAACQHMRLTPPDTLSCPTLGLACVLMLIPFLPGLVLFLEFELIGVLRHIQRYFSHVCDCTDVQFRTSLGTSVSLIRFNTNFQCVT